MGRVFRKIVFPLIRPIIVTIAVLQFFVVYGDFVIARVMLRSTDNLTVIVGLLLFQTQRFEQDWGIITAGAVLATLPVLLLYIPVQKYVISGLTSGAVKVKRFASQAELARRAQRSRPSAALKSTPQVDRQAGSIYKWGAPAGASAPHTPADYPH